MITFSKAKCALDCLEQKWQAKLKSSIPASSVPSLCNGESQFFAIEDIYSTAPVNQRRVLVAAIGINFSQDSKALYSFPTPHIYRVTKKASWVADYNYPEMRAVLNIALEEYFHNAGAWHKNGYASSNALATSLRSGDPRDYILIATNISPFISTKTWTQHSKSGRVKALAAWDPNQHLCALARCFAADIDLWVVHGKGEVWPSFCKKGAFRHWIITPNLSCRNLSNNSITSFWKSPCPALSSPPESPLHWPLCRKSNCEGQEYDAMLAKGIETSAPEATT